MSAAHVRCTGAGSLEMRGELTDGETRALDRLTAGWWELVSQAEPGLHIVQVRIDGGAWRAPDELPTATTPSGEPAGTLAVR